MSKGMIIGISLFLEGRGARGSGEGTAFSRSRNELEKVLVEQVASVSVNSRRRNDGYLSWLRNSHSSAHYARNTCNRKALHITEIAFIDSSSGQCDFTLSSLERKPD